MTKFTAVRTKGERHVAFQVAQMWAREYPRASAGLRIKLDEAFEGMSEFEFRITSTARGNLTPTTEGELRHFIIGVTKFANDSGYHASIAVEAGGGVRQ
jgi:hypothetical protein